MFGVACLELLERESPIYWVLGAENSFDVEHCSETIAVFGAARVWSCSFGITRTETLV